MDIDIQPGIYVVAVSGGVDSVSLLHQLTQNRTPLKLIVAHLDHGIRQDSALDRQLVQEQARRYGLSFVYNNAQLGPQTSEALARQARYNFLHRVREASGAKAIITAHHQDDVLETAIINLLRGTGRLGLTSLKNTDLIIRPLLHVSKQDLIDYAKKHGLSWREDSTNKDTAYLRNRVRHQFLPRFGQQHRQRLVDIVNKMHDVNNQIDVSIINQLHVQPALDRLDRHWFIMLPHAVARETLAVWLRLNGSANFDKKTLERLTIAAKTYQSGRRTDINKSHILGIGKQQLALLGRER